MSVVEVVEESVAFPAKSDLDVCSRTSRSVEKDIGPN